MVIDLLDNLEWYQGLHPQMERLIILLDRGTIHEQGPGSYQVDGLSYEVRFYTSSEEPVAYSTDTTELQILLEGSELYSILRQEETRLVTTATEGLFLLLQPDTTYRIRAAESGSEAIKKVIFTLA